MYKEIDLDRIDTTGLPPENDPERLTVKISCKV